MISLKRSTLGFVVLVTLVVGAGLGTWGAGAVDQIKPAAPGGVVGPLPSGTQPRERATNAAITVIRNDR